MSTTCGINGAASTAAPAHRIQARVAEKVGEGKLQFQRSLIADASHINATSGIADIAHVRNNVTGQAILDPNPMTIQRGLQAIDDSVDAAMQRPNMNAAAHAELEKYRESAKSTFVQTSIQAGIDKGADTTPWRTQFQQFINPGQDRELMAHKNTVEELRQRDITFQQRQEDRVQRQASDQRMQQVFQSIQVGDDGVPHFPQGINEAVARDQILRPENKVTLLRALNEAQTAHTDPMVQQQLLTRILGQPAGTVKDQDVWGMIGHGLSWGDAGHLVNIMHPKTPQDPITNRMLNEAVKSGNAAVNPPTAVGTGLNVMGAAIWSNSFLNWYQHGKAAGWTAESMLVAGGDHYFLNEPSLNPKDPKFRVLPNMSPGASQPGQPTPGQPNQGGKVKTLDDILRGD